ncbi:MAG: transporter substrate-binding domain-containing protein [Bacteriovorax sp.]|nr:transporter substrate-binding domain-containing protein [Bacteriovorax sp.]
MQKTILLFFALMSFFIQSAFALSDADLKKMVLPNNRVIKITGHPQYPPFVWKDKNKNELIGITIEILEKAFAEINVKAQIVYVETWGRAQEEVKLGHIDILVPPYKNEERVKFYNFSPKTIFMDETVLFVKKGKEFNFKNLTDLKNHRGVAIINDSFGTEFDNFDKSDLHIDRLSTTEQCFKFLNLDRAEYVVAGLYSGLSVLKKLKLSETVTFLPNRVIITGMYAPVSIKSPWNKDEIGDYLVRKITEYEKNGLVKKLEKKYIEKMKEEYM